MKLTTLPERVRALAAIHRRFEQLAVAVEGCEGPVASHPAGSESAPHRHESENWGAVLRGRILNASEGRERPYGAGEWYRVPRGALHSARCVVDCEILRIRITSREPLTRLSAV